MTPAKTRVETSAASAVGNSSSVLMTYRAILWLALAAYPFVLKGMHAASEFANPLLVRGLGFLGLAAACIPAAMALLCLHELPKLKLTEHVRRNVGREAILGGISAALFIVINNSLNLMKLLPLRDGTWWTLITLIFLMKFLPVRTNRFSSEVGTRKIHIAAAAVILHGAYAVKARIYALGCRRGGRLAFSPRTS